MVTYTGGRAAGFTASVVLGAFLCFGVAFLVIAATIVLSLISVYTPNHSEEGYGEQYQIKAFFLKALYQNILFPVNNSSVVNSAALSTLCGSMYQRQGVKNFPGCLAQSFLIFGPYNSSNSSRRRRRASVAYAGAYEIGEVNLYYSTSCPKKGDKLKYANSTSLSHCVQNRLAACNNLVNSSSNFTQWTPLPNPFAQTIVSQNGADSHTIEVASLFGIPFSTASALANSLNLAVGIKANIQLGCQYIGPLPQANITNALLAQSAEATTHPTSSDSPYG